MDGTIRTFLDFVAMDAIAEVLLDPRPAFVCADERVVWANAAGVAFFGQRNVDDLLAWRLSALNPLRAQIARLSRLLPTDATRLEVLRIGFGVSLMALPAACRRLNLDDGTSAVLAVAAAGGTNESLAARAERLVTALAGGGRIAAVVASGGRVLAASEGFDGSASFRGEIAGLIAAAGSGVRTAAHPIAVGSATRTAEAVRFTADGRDCFLVVAGPAEAVAIPAEPAQPEPAAIEPSVEAAVVPAEPLPEPETLEVPPRPTPAPRSTTPVARFVWESDGEARFTFVSQELAEAVGEANAAVVGKTWDTVAEVLALDPEGRIGAALAANAPWTARVFWPAAGRGERIAVDLSGMPAPGGKGFRGFGACHPDERRPDERSEAKTLTDIDVADAPPAETSEEAVDRAAQKGIEEGTAADTRTPAPAPSNIVRLPGTQAPAIAPERLSGSEQDAFRRIAEALAAGKAKTGRSDAEAGTHEEQPAQATAAPSSVAIDSRILDRIPAGIAIVRDQEVLFANQALLDLVGDTSFEAFVAAGGVDAVFPYGGSAWGERLARDGSLMARRRDGVYVPVAVRLHTVRWGPASALMLTITPRRGPANEAQATQRLAAAEARAGELEAILDTATDGVVVIDRAGVIGSMNRAAQALFGVEAGDLVGHRFTELLAEESGKPALDYLDGLATNGVASVLNDGREVIGKVPQGGLIPLFMTMGRLGKSDKFCAVLRDITHWKHVEEELTAARHAAEVANAQKSDFLAKVSHEIRTPLNAILGFTEVMMEERFGPVTNERYRAYLGDIHKSGGHLMSLINDLLDLSKIEAGKLDMSFESVAVNTIIQECVALMQPQANRRRIIIRTSLSTEVPDIVADRRSFRQILLNLMSNAVKFTKPGGQVIVSSMLENTGEVVVRIRDTGIGMSEKDIETAMKPFRQVASVREGQEKGTGLGLPLTKALVEANRANLTIDSAKDQGTLVKITFPTTRVLAG